MAEDALDRVIELARNHRHLFIPELSEQRRRLVIFEGCMSLRILIEQDAQRRIFDAVSGLPMSYCSAFRAWPAICSSPPWSRLKKMASSGPFSNLVLARLISPFCRSTKDRALHHKGLRHPQALAL